MELSFETFELRELCEIKTVGEKRLGATIASELRICLADLCAADSMVDLPDKPHKIEKEQFSIKQESGLEVKFTPNHIQRSGIRDLSTIHRIRILEIKYHG